MVRILGHERISALDLPEPILTTVLSLKPRHWLASNPFGSNQFTGCCSQIEGPAARAVTRRARKTNSGSRLDKRISSGHRSPLISTEQAHRYPSSRPTDRTEGGFLVACHHGPIGSR